MAMQALQHWTNGQQGFSPELEIGGLFGEYIKLVNGKECTLQYRKMAGTCVAQPSVAS